MERKSMQRIFCSGIILLVLLVYTGKSETVGDVETVIRKVTDNVTLDCPQVLPGEVYGSLMWKHKGQLLASLTTSQQLVMADQSMKDKGVSVLPNWTLVIDSVSLGLAGTFSCILDVTVNGSVDSKTLKYNLVVQDKPERPKKPDVTDVTSTDVNVLWEASDSNNSPINTFILSARKCGDDKEVKRVSVAGDQPVETTVDGLEPFTCYTVSVVARNGIGDSPPSAGTDEFYTEEEDNMDNGTLIIDFNSTTTVAPVTLPTAVVVFQTSVTSNEIMISWDKPTVGLNGELLGYNIEYEKFSAKRPLTAITVENPDKTAITVRNVSADSMYTVSIRVYNSKGPGPWTETVVKTAEGKPGLPRIITVNRHTATSFYIHWEPPLEPNGNVISYTIVWSLDGVNKSRAMFGHMPNPMQAYISDLKPYRRYKLQVAASTKAGRGPYTEPYQALTDVAAPSAPRNLSLTVRDATSIHLKWELPAHVYRKVDSYFIKLWDHRGTNIRKTINGHLTEYNMTNLIENSRYHLKLAAVTKRLFKNESRVGDFTESITFVLGEFGNVINTFDKPMSAEEADSSSVSPIVIAAIVCVLLVGIVVIVLFVGYKFYMCRRCYEAAYLYLAVPSNGHSIPQTNIIVEEPSEEKQYSDVPVNDFISHAELMHTDSDIAFSQEFDEINRATNTDKYGFENSNAADNRMKNRYINIVAYDHSRVVLKSEMGRPRQSDYINANYVDGYQKPKAYIATQGPLPSTFPDFWRMVWEQNTTVVVMITNLMEKGRRKCDQYWPNDGGETYGNIQVKLINTVPRAHYTVRIFTLKNLKRHSMKGVNERTVYHYHYTEWPDHGVPDYSLPVLDFIQKSAAHSGPDSGPIIVHCSAGVGRTGTYIVIDSMIAQIQDKRSINIPGFTQFIRRQRNYLVQTEDQYIFIHSVLVEYLLGGGATAVREEHLSEYLVQLEQPPNDQFLHCLTETSLLHKQMQLITSYQPNDADLYAAQRICNVGKNREGALLPVNLKRVLLPARPGVEGSDYINASYLQGYERSGEFVVTQHPMADTMEDFWRMVWDRNSTAIVVLSPMDEEEFKEFWPPKDSSIEVDAGNFRLAMKEGPIVDEEQGTSTYEFILDSIQYDYTLMTRIVCVKDWPSSYTELHTAFNVISTVHDYISSVECGPVVVMDKFGGASACAFCALWTLRDELLTEKCVDFYQLAKLYHYKRPGILGSEEDYLFLHQAIAALSRQMGENPSLYSSSKAHPHHHHNYLFNNYNNHSSSSNNHNQQQHQMNGTLPRANPPNHYNNSNNNATGLPRSNTIDNGTTTTTATTTTTTTTNNGAAVVVNTDYNNDDDQREQEEVEATGEETHMINIGDNRNSVAGDRNSAAGVENGNGKVETNI